MPAPKHLIDGDLCADLLLNLELIQAGGIPSPERAGELRRRLNDAIVESMRGFTRRDPAKDDLYKTVPPPPPEAA
jgi:hypothetical protein